ncbi:protein ROH1-like [Lolium rigidum]|uniref:protein ROH1-like n=1 Tax=Lolium rigidum TaxID=89674 RepID=UPI001F5CED82|nr:protein ROH1-like [Lolium rigidum]
MPAKVYHGSLSLHYAHYAHSPFSSIDRSLLSQSWEADIEDFQWHVAVRLAELRDREGFLSFAWIGRLLEAFLQCQEEFRVMVAQARRSGGWGRQAEMLVAAHHQRAVNALDVCNAARYGFVRVQCWGRLANIAASALLAPGEIQEGQLRRAFKALFDLSALLVEDPAAPWSGSGVASFLSSHRNSSFSFRTPASSSRASSSSVSSSSSSSHFSPFPWSVSRTWSAARQLQAIGSGLAAPGAHDEGLAAPAYAMGCMLHLTSWALIAAVPCPDRGTVLQANFLPPLPPALAFPWALPLLTLQDRLTEEGKRKDRRNSCGLLKEIHALEKCVQRLAEAIDAAAIPLSWESKAEVREAAAELAAVCTTMKDGLEPLGRQVREVFHRIARSRTECFDSRMPNTY